MFGGPGDGDGNGKKRLPRSIRFSDQEWARVETFAIMRGITGGELVRAAVLAAVGDGAGAGEAGRPMTPLIERTFRYVHVLATAMRARMLEEGRAEELEALVREARELQRALQKRPAE